MLRKFVSLFLILVLLLSTASATSEPIPDEIVYTNGVTINHILNHTAFDKIFNTNSQGSSYSSNDEYGNINLYLSMVSAPNSMYETTLDFEVNIGGDTHLISTHGTSYELIPYENGSILFGDLVGHTFINGTECDVNVGMLKATDSETVSVAVTIIPQNARDWNDVVRFDFGGTVITPEMVSNMNTKQSNNHGGKIVSRCLMMLRKYLTGTKLLLFWLVLRVMMAQMPLLIRRSFSLHTQIMPID